MLEPPADRSFFLFGPRGVGKTAWVRARFPGAPYFDLLDHGTHGELTASPGRLGEQVPLGCTEWVVIDEIQRVPELLNEVHRLIESRSLRFVLTGSSARKLRREGTNLLGGRAVLRNMHPLTAGELGKDFDLMKALRFGCMPSAWTTGDPADYLASYASVCIRQEVMQEGFIRKAPAFFRFLEVASLSQGGVLNRAAVARDCGVSAKVVEDYFTILEDLLIGLRLPAFTRRARRRVVAHPKFYFFDAGVFQALHPRGPLDGEGSIRGVALETLLLQQVRAVNDYGRLGYGLHYWRTPAGDEVDLVLYGERGLVAVEVMSATRVRDEDLRGLLRFRRDYPEARAYLLHLGDRTGHDRGVELMPFGEFLQNLSGIL